MRGGKLLKPRLTRVRNDARARRWNSQVALKLELRPNERVIVGDCVITNDNQRTRLLVEGTVPILRERDIMALSAANSPAKRIYLAVQLMYTSRRPEEHQELYLRLVRQILKAAPSTRRFIENINNQILTGKLYKALKETRKLIAYERELLDHATRQQRLQQDGQGNSQPA